MPFAESKRKFLVRVLGEERTAALEKMLPEMEARLESSGVGWKDAGTLKVALESPERVGVGYSDDEPEVVVAVLPGPTTFAEAEAAEAAREKGAEVRSLTSIFEMLLTNIMALPEAEAASKVKLLEQAMRDLTGRISKVGAKSLASSPAAPYVALLTGSGSAIKSVEVEELQGPASRIVRDLLTGGAVQG